MKPPAKSADIVLKALKKVPLASKLQQTVNIPVLTNKESRNLLNAINSSFRKALDDSRHPDDVFPPASINNTYANKADDHVYRVLKATPTTENDKHPDLRTLMDPGTIGLFEQHIWQGTATLDLAVKCLQKYISLELQNPRGNHRRDGGLIMLSLLNQQNMIRGVPEPPLRGWLTAALLLSSKPTYPIGWVLKYLEQKKFADARALIAELFTAYTNIYRSKPLEAIALFVHILKYKEKSYRRQVSLHPRTKIAGRLEPERLMRLSNLFEDEAVIRSGLLVDTAQMLYNKADVTGRRLIAEALDLWNLEPSAFGGQVALKHFNNPFPGVGYLVSLGMSDSSDIALERGGIVSNAIMGLQVIKELLRMNQQELAKEATRIVSERLLPVKEAVEEEVSTLDNQLELLRALLESDGRKLNLANEYVWDTTLRDVRKLNPAGAEDT
ncbi:hypothetical protein ABW19_dt0210586 [Dactylella cylindrospora]|nr:hypothetical protein ABW19_dt0210586 [Dactylella cylindrospora]